MLQLAIDDTSPTLSFFPFRDTLSAPDLSAGWNPYYPTSGFASAPGKPGSGLSSHITSKDGASLSLTWHGNGIQLFGNATLSSYSVNLDGSDMPNDSASPTLLSSTNGVLVDIGGLKEDKHTITLTVQISQAQTPRTSSMLVFDKAIVRTGNPAINETFAPHCIDHTTLAYLGRWSFESDFQGMTFHISNTVGDKVNTKFNGTAFRLSGRTEPDAGNYSIALDGVTTTLSAQSSFVVPNATLFFATGLSSGVEHLVEVQNNGGKLSILENGFEEFVTLLAPPPPETKGPDPSYPSGTIAAFGLGGILFFILVTAGLYVFLWRPRRRRKSSITASFDKKFRFPTSPGTIGKKAGLWASGLSTDGRQRKESDAIDIVRSQEMSASCDDLEYLEINADDMRHSRSTSGFTRWHRGVVDGGTQSLALPTLFTNDYSDEAVSGNGDCQENKHPYVRYSSRWAGDSPPMETEQSYSLSETDHKDLAFVALTNLKNKGKARQITGSGSIIDKEGTTGRTGSPIPSFLQGLHVKFSSSTKNWPNLKLGNQSNSLSLSLNAPPSPIPGSSQERGDSALEQMSPSFAAENSSPMIRIKRPPPTRPAVTPRSRLSSVPRSVADSKSNQKTSSSPRQRESRLLLEGEDDTVELHSYDNELAEHPLSPPRHAHVRRHPNFDNDQSSFSSQAIRNLSPRTCERGERSGIRASRLGVDRLSSGVLDDVSQKEDISNAGKPSTEKSQDVPSSMHFARNVSPSVHLKRESTERHFEERAKQEADDVLQSGLALPNRARSHVLPSLKRTSPFNLKFDWQSDRPGGPPVSRPTSRSKTSKQSTQNGVVRNHHLDHVQSNRGGASRSWFRLTTSTLANPPFSPQQSQMSSDVVASFIDFTSSSEGSARAKSFKTFQTGEGTFGDPENQPPPFDLLELASQLEGSGWSDTSLSTGPRRSPRELRSLDGSSSSPEKSSFYTAVQTIDGGLSPANPGSTRRQSDPTTTTQISSENPLHVHPPVIPDLQPPSGSLPRNSDSEGSFGSASSSRRTTDSSNNALHTRLLLASRYPPLPEGTEDAASSS